MNGLTEKEFLDQFKKTVKTTGVRAFAREAHVAPSTITRIVQGKLPPAGRVLKAMGFERVVIYRNVGTKNRALTSNEIRL